MTQPFRSGDIAGGFAPGEGREHPPLFRPEALAAAKGGVGRPIAALPLSWSLISATLVVLLIAFVALLSFGSYSRKETAVGIVRAVGGDIHISGRAGGIASEVSVSDGQLVRSGDTLVVIETPRNNLQGQSLNAAIIESLDREIAALQHRIESLQRESRIQQEGARAQMLALQSELSVATAQEAASRQRLALATESLGRVEQVAERGFVSGESVRRRREEVIVLRQAVEDARGIQSRIKGQIAEVRSLRARLPLESERQRGQLQDEIARARRDRANYVGQQGYAIKAPADGRVSALQVSEGQSIQAQQPLMTLARPGAAVSAEIFVPSRSIGFLAPEQEVKVRYDAFPYQRFGTATGKVRSISSTILRPDEVQAAVAVEEPVYRVLVELDSDHLTAYGRKFRIRPGLSLNASIVLEERSFADWLLDPIIALRGRI